MKKCSFIRLWPLVVGLLVAWSTIVPGSMVPLVQLSTYGGYIGACDVHECTYVNPQSCEDLVNSSCTGVLVSVRCETTGYNWQILYEETVEACSGPIPECTGNHQLVYSDDCYSD